MRKWNKLKKLSSLVPYSDTVSSKEGHNKSNCRVNNKLKASKVISLLVTSLVKIQMCSFHLLKKEALEMLSSLPVRVII